MIEIVEKQNNNNDNNNNSSNDNNKKKCQTKNQPSIAKSNLLQKQFAFPKPHSLPQHQQQPESCTYLKANNKEKYLISKKNEKSIKFFYK